jgi:hypothetical protein
MGIEGVQVDRILGERRAARNRCTAEHALRRGKTVGLVLARVHEETEHLDEIRALDRHVDAEDAQPDSLHARNIDRTRQ